MSEEIECIICFKEISDRNKCITKCNHLFCFECIFIYFQNKNECPLCRGALIPIDKYTLNNKKKIYIVNYSRGIENLPMHDDTISNVTLIERNDRNIEEVISYQIISNEMIYEYEEIDENEDIPDLEEVPNFTEPI